MLDVLPDIPTPVWGRDELGTGEMWNSNAVIAWTLERAGANPVSLRPPGLGRAPGWNAGVTVAAALDRVDPPRLSSSATRGHRTFRTGQMGQ